METTPILSTERLAVGYHGIPLISNIALQVRRGTIVTLIGPNGGGKSTILKSLVRQLPILGGTVLLCGTSLQQMPSRTLARTMSILMTERITPERMTCAEVVAFGRYPYTGQLGILSAEDKRQIAEAMRLTDVEALAEMEFSQLSDGQRQRVMLARAICQEPELLVMDEPTSFLDVHHKLKLLQILKELVQKKNIAVLVSLHELDLAQRISDYVVCVRNQKIDRCGTPEEMFTDGYIAEVYGLQPNQYQAAYGVVELAPPKGIPKTFVIAGGGKGIPVFRKLQREQMPFYTGVLHENDLDYPVARALAADVVVEEAFEPIGEAAVERAKALVKDCEMVICCLERFGKMNARNQELLEYAKANKKQLKYIS